MDLFIGLVALFLYLFFLWVCLCFFVWFCLFRFAFTICPTVLSVRIFVCLFVCFYHCVCVCFFVWFCLFKFALPFVLGFCLFFLLLLCFICFFLFMTLCVYVSLCDFVCLVLLLPFVLRFYLFVSFFCSSFPSEPCSWQGLGAPAYCQAWASEVGEPRPGYWTTRDLPAPHNINQWELSQRSPSQH